MQVSVKTSFYNTGKQTSFWKQLRIFKRKKNRDRDIRKIENYIWENNEDQLNANLERMAKTLVKLEGQKINDEVVSGLV